MLASVCTLLLSLPCVREAETQGPAAFSPRTTSLSIVRAAKQADAAEERFFRRMEAEVCQDHSTGSNGFSPVSSPTRVCVRACVRACVRRKFLTLPGCPGCNMVVCVLTERPFTFPW
jgi:hypothetical protein